MPSIETPHFLIHDGRVRLRSGGGGVSNALADHIAAELAPLGLVPDGPAFERTFVDAVLATHPDPMQAWTAFYDNTMRRLRRPESGGAGCVATFARIYQHVLSLIRGTTVLDVGCCFGFLPLLMAEQNPRLRVIGTDLALAQLRRVARHRVVIAVPLEEVPDSTFGHMQAFDLPGLARIGADPETPGWSQAVHAADGGWLVLDRRARGPTAPGGTARLGRQPLS